MNLFEEYQICPYTGLRSFTEEESLYFKGREEDIDQATSQLQRNKFLMLTGASGDGKSSLIYAGIIPNARAGFLKSRYTQWCVADFRPERTPFQNLCRSVAKQLEIEDTRTVQAELGHGFSALADLYRNSKRYVDTGSSEWRHADEKKRAAMKRDAANLIVLADQFEEFFTNPENYNHGVPSKDSNLVLNLLLETARIALEEDLPIYVVFTMRSDYIGQCAAFRGLPEYLGFSQFFVPRLNRAQLQQVIEEPAALSGNRITRRLTERLIHDITEGVDQLPILQHALNQIWVAASRGKEEMDLVHYAMVGGMAVEELPDDQIPRFKEWFSQLPEPIRKCYNTPSLQNVLDTHCNKLYEQAAGYYKKHTGKGISDEQAKGIIRNAFTCLTKIDQSRAVRNRMTLEEITRILGDPLFESGDVGALLNIFREPGNTFIHPFITEEDAEKRELEPGQVLDITHESLIRNWEYLGQWAKDEFESRNISIDFEQQLGRWVESGKSGSFLLSIGPLTYFENWYNRAKPNIYWIARYLPQEESEQSRLAKAGEILDNSREFLQRSARKHVVTRTVMRYGPRRIAAVLGALAFVVLTSFMVRDYFNKQNSAVLNSITKESQTLAGDPKLVYISKIRLLIEELKLGLTTVDEIVNGVKDPLTRISIASGIGSNLTFQGLGTPRKELERSFFLADSLLELYQVPLDNPIQLSSALSEVNRLRVVLEMAGRLKPDVQKENWRKRNAQRSAKWVLAILEKQPAGFEDAQNLNLALENGLNYQAFSNSELSRLLQILSPFENGLNSVWLQKNYDRDKIMNRGSLDYGFKFNGLYQELAYLYAATGNSGMALRCMDSLLQYSQNNYQGDYANGADNGANIAAVFYLNGKQVQGDEFTEGYCQRKKISLEEFYARLLGRTIQSYTTFFNSRLYPFMNDVQNLNLQFTASNQLHSYYEKYREVVTATVPEADRRNFLMAMSYKNEGVQQFLLPLAPDAGTRNVDSFFNKALKYYQQVSHEYMEKRNTVVGTSGADQMNMPNKFLFLYPDMRTPFHPLEPRSFFYFYFSDAFLDYVLRHQLVDSLYTNMEEFGFINSWLTDFNSKTFFIRRSLVFQLPRTSNLAALEEILQRRDAGGNLDLNFLNLYLGKEAQDSGQTEKMLYYYDQVKRQTLFNILTSKEFNGQIRDYSFRLIGHAVKGYTRSGHFDQALTLVSQFKSPVNRSTLYAFAASHLIRAKSTGAFIQQLIDSSKAELNRIENTTDVQPNRAVLSYALAMQSPSRNSEEAVSLIKNLPQKVGPLQNISRSFGFHGDLFHAKARIPGIISRSDRADFLFNILMGYSSGKGRDEEGWGFYNSNYLYNLEQPIRYQDENF